MNTQPTTIQKIAGRLNAVLLPKYIDFLLEFKIFHHDRSVDPARNEYDQHCIFSFWHEYIGLVLPRFGHLPLTVLVSQHRDGEWVNQTAKALGLNIVRGSSTRGGVQAIRELKKHREFSSITFTPDGPRGPRRQMALGPIYLASVLGMPVVPVGVGFENPWRLKTWDRFAIPRPFTRARMIFGPKIFIPRNIKREALESERVRIQAMITELTVQAENWAASGSDIDGQQPFVRKRRTNKVFFRQKDTAQQTSKAA